MSRFLKYDGNAKQICDNRVEDCTCWFPPVGPTRFQKIYPSVGSTICLLSWRNSFLLLVKQRLLWTRFLIIGKIVHYVFAPILPRVGLVILNCCLKVAQQSLHLTRNEHFLRVQEKSCVSSKSSHDVLTKTPGFSPDQGLQSWNMSVTWV